MSNIKNKKKYLTFEDYKNSFFPRKINTNVIENETDAFNTGKKLAEQSFNKFKHILTR